MADTILLVDDEEGIRNVLGISLKDLGYDVLTAKDGEEALRLFQEFKPSIVLTDIKMPGMDGIDLLRSIKAERPDTEVIMITGHGDMDLAIGSLKSRATDFVTKPVNVDMLEVALQRANERLAMRATIRAYTQDLEKLVQEQAAKLVNSERLAAIGQVIEGLPSAMKGIVETLDDDIKFFNEMPCFVAIHNRDLEIVSTNQLYRERLGDKGGIRSWEIYILDNEGDLDCPASRTFKTGTGQRSREIVKDIEGKEIPVIVHTAPIRNREQEVNLVLEISVDITEVKRLQAELRVTQHKYQQLFNEAPCYISVQDKDLRLAETNRRFKEDFGDDIGSFCYEIYKHRTEPCSDCPVEKTFTEGKSQTYETVVTSKNGEQNNVLIWTAPINDANGEIAQVMEMSTNITQIRKLQDHLSSLGLLIGSISHGLKGLLTALDGGMYRVDAGFAKENQDQIKEGWEVVRLMVSRIRNLVINLLYYAKERDLEWVKVDALSFAGEVAFAAKQKIQDNDIEFFCDFDTSAGEFEIDTGVVHSALINIMENAVDACLEDKTNIKHKIIFSLKQDEKNIIFEVNDNGLGMDQETRENIFTLFFSSKGNKGTGLGLFISNQIIQQHGGSIKVDSTLGQGSSFKISMPKVLPETAKIANKEHQAVRLRAV
ncbi:MAG: response regulator [Deltaproteobacteria bacterium]|nr:response regulator [Deltaproteobacteria bacterium]